MSYALTFTRKFKDGLSHLPHEVFPIIDRQLRNLETDPYAKNPNATPMRNGRHLYRLRIGLHVRLLYQVQTSHRRVVILTVGTRENFYQQMAGGAALRKIEADNLRAEISGSVSKHAAAEPKAQSIKAVELTVHDIPKPAEPEPPIEVEETPWITEDELFLLHIDSSFWRVIIDAGSMDAIRRLNTVDAVTCDRIEDYCTNPAGTQVEKLYSLGTEIDAQALACAPLASFLLALDPEQQSALRKLKDAGPYLIKGAAGTGKTLVGLYHISELIRSRRALTLFDGPSPPIFGVITYTNTLVDVNRELICAITPPSEHESIKCTTLDLIARRIAEQAIGTKPNPYGVRDISNLIKDRILPKSESAIKELIERLGTTYIAEEIEHVIIGNGLISESDYQSATRRGRKRPLREKERSDIWKVFLKIKDHCAELKAHTWEQLRVIARNYLRTHPAYPRFSALFVDEAQDFSKVAKQLCLELVKDSRWLVLAADTAQSIYTTPTSWNQVDARLNFQRRRPIALITGYRSTREIVAAIAPLRVDPGDEEDRSNDASPVYSGPKPRWLTAPLADHVKVLLNEIIRLTNEQKTAVHVGQIAIIARTKLSADYYTAQLIEAGIRAKIVDKNRRLETNGQHVHVVTAHSSKGLSFPIVIVPGVSDHNYPDCHQMAKAKDDQQREQIEEIERRLLYVTLSRASHNLIMIADDNNPSRFLRALNRTEHWSQ